MQTFQVQLDGTKTVYDYTQVERCNQMILQSPQTNSNYIYIGEKGREYGFIAPGGCASLEITNPQDVSIIGTSPDVIIILLF